MTIFLFDVDGTLTDARKPIDPDFKEFMFEFMNRHHCVIVTGSDRPKTVEQIGLELTNTFHKVYHCSGNHVFIGNQEHHKNTWKLSDEQYSFLENLIDSIDYKEKTGNHIEQRTGTANFSICGRNANWDQREKYKLWEKQHQAREFIAETYNNTFSDSIAQVAGETSLDIFPVGCDKGQVLNDYKNSKTIFFGDNCFPGGNDHSAAQASTHFHQIDQGYKQTWEILKKRYF
jgi:phosphomannomutase